MGLFDRHAGLLEAIATFARRDRSFQIRMERCCRPPRRSSTANRPCCRHQQLFRPDFDRPAWKRHRGDPRRGHRTTGSRIANGSYTEHVALEQEIAQFYGKKHCMVFTTGYQANLA